MYAIKTHGNNLIYKYLNVCELVEVLERNKGIRERKTRVERKPYLENTSERLRLAISKSVKLNLTTLLKSMYLMLKKDKITIT